MESTLNCRKHDMRKESFPPLRQSKASSVSSWTKKCPPQKRLQRKTVNLSDVDLGLFSTLRDSSGLLRRSTLVPASLVKVFGAHKTPPPPTTTTIERVDMTRKAKRPPLRGYRHRRNISVSRCRGGRQAGRTEEEVTQSPLESPGAKPKRKRHTDSQELCTYTF